MATATAPPQSCNMPLALLIFLSLLVPSALGVGLACEDLPTDKCAFAVSSSSKRCVLESYQRGGGAPTEYKCRTSEVVVGRISDYVETDSCVSACGVDRNWVGISSDALLEAEFKDKLCSPECFQNCANIIDLYYNLASGEGLSLPDLCHEHRSNPRRAMAQLMSSGAAAGPAASPTASLQASDRDAASPTASPAASPAANPRDEDKVVADDDGPFQLDNDITDEDSVADENGATDDGSASEDQEAKGATDDGSASQDQEAKGATDDGSASQDQEASASQDQEAKGATDDGSASQDQEATASPDTEESGDDDEEDAEEVEAAG